MVPEQERVNDVAPRSISAPEDGVQVGGLAWPGTGRPRNGTDGVREVPELDVGHAGGAEEVRHPLDIGLPCPGAWLGPHQGSVAACEGWVIDAVHCQGPPEGGT